MHDPPPPSDPRATVVPTDADAASFPQIAGYRVVRRLGQGGMATVYLATQESLDRPVSIKVMEREGLLDETSKQRFENEARTIAKLTHPSIVAIHDVGRTADGRMYYSMPFLPNGDLSQHDLGADDLRVVELLRALLSALAYAHGRGVVHRDVKRENVLFDTSNHPQLADFGIAMSTDDTVRITSAGFAVGSSGYMAPEQARGDVVDGRADLYSVGVLAHELLTGALPYRSSDPLAVALMHAQKPVPKLPPAKRHWQEFIDRAMAKDPAQRYANAQEMLQALDRIARRSGSQLSRRVLRTLAPGGSPRPWKWPLVAVGVALLLVAVVLAARGGWLGWPGGARNPATVAANAPGPAPMPPPIAGPASAAMVPAAASAPAAALPSPTSTSGTTTQAASDAPSKPTPKPATHHATAKAPAPAARTDFPALRAVQSRAQAARDARAAAVARRNDDASNREDDERAPGWQRRCLTRACEQRTRGKEKHHRGAR